MFTFSDYETISVQNRLFFKCTKNIEIKTWQSYHPDKTLPVSPIFLFSQLLYKSSKEKKKKRKQPRHHDLCSIGTVQVTPPQTRAFQSHQQTWRGHCSLFTNTDAEGLRDLPAKGSQGPRSPLFHSVVWEPDVYFHLVTFPYCLQRLWQLGRWCHPRRGRIRAENNRGGGQTEDKSVRVAGLPPWASGDEGLVPQGAADFGAGLSRRKDKSMCTHTVGRCGRCSGLPYQGVGVHLTHARTWGHFHLRRRAGGPTAASAQQRLWTLFPVWPRLPAPQLHLAVIDTQLQFAEGVNKKQRRWMNEVNNTHWVHFTS